MQNNHIVFILVLIFIFYDQSIQLCQKFSNHLIISTINKTIPISKRCYTIGQCHLTVTTSDYHHHIKLKQNNDSSQLFFSSKFKLLINYDSHNTQMLFSSISTNGIINTTNISTKNCYIGKEFVKRNTRQYNRSGSTSSIIITFNSSSFIDYRHKTILNYPLRLSVRFRTLGRISNGVLFSLIYGKSISSIIPFIIIEHTNGKIEITILRLDERKVLSNVTSIQCGKNVNNDNWHKLYFEIDLNGIFKIVVDDDIRTSQIPTYVVSSWNINALLVGDTRRLNTDIFQPFIGYMSDLIFNDEYLFKNLITRKQDIQSLFHIYSQHIIVGYRIAFFNLITIETQTSHIAFSERESQNKNHGKLDIYFLFRSYVPDGIILYRYAQGLNEYFAIGLRAGILTLFMDFGFGKRQIVSDESTKLADGKWHEVRVTRIGTDKIELVVDNRVNRSTLSANGIRNAVSLQPVLYIGGIPNNNLINLTDSGLNSYGFQGCLSSFIVDGRLLDYQTALALHGKVNMNVCSDLNKLCYDFTCIHSGICITNDNDGPKCDCMETAYIGERCDKLPNGFYFGKRNLIGSLEYVMAQTRQTEHDIITFGLQTYSISAQIFRLESDLNLYSLEYEIVRGRSYIKLNLGEKQSDIYSAITHITDGIYHAIKIIRKFSIIELYVDGIRIKLEGGNKYLNQLESKSFLAQRRLRIGNFKNISQWNGIIADCPYIDECIYPCSIEPDKLFDALDWMDKEMIALATPKLIGTKPNAFSFSHWLAETILSNEQKNLPSMSIIRVSIIGASWKEPYPGWVEKSNGPNEFFVAAGRGYLRSMKGDSNDVLDIIPVDIPVNLSIVAGWQKYSENNNNITIYNCTSSGLNPFHWQEMSNYFIEYSKRIPYEHAFRRPNLSVTNHSLIHDSYRFFSHLIPAYLADIGLCLIGHKPHIVNIYKNLHRTLIQLESFTIREEIQCSYDNLNSLRQLIIETNNFNDFYFDIRALHWPTYIESYLIGIKRYILNENINCLNHAQKHLNNLRNIRWTFNIIILILLWRIFISKRPTARNLWYFIINFFVAKFVRFFKILSAGNA
ncbi:unnamed protein product [Rotaria sordida]|uniref:Fatty acyl-CoA reductase n=1 Tax=Rotaria sordida TaxID=392033 RepID=A0A815LRK9_9BILA|nr:unnamed protein product [Rotaria sordida]